MHLLSDTEEEFPESENKESEEKTVKEEKKGYGVIITYAAEQGQHKKSDIHLAFIDRLAQYLSRFINDGFGTFKLK